MNITRAVAVRQRRAALMLAAASLFPALAAAQSRPARGWAPAVSAGMGNGHVFRYADQSFGDAPNVSAAFALMRHNGVGVEVEANRTIGLSPEPAPCGVLINGASAACEGAAREGVLDAASVSFNFRYQVVRYRLQPYFLAGLGILHTRAVASVTTVRGSTVTLSEIEDSSTGLGPDIGAGVRIPVAAGLSVDPEIRWLAAASLSRHNLAVTRASVRVAYGW
jgi:opacity protein-like surface antigen